MRGFIRLLVRLAGWILGVFAEEADEDLARAKRERDERELERVRVEAKAEVEAARAQREADAAHADAEKPVEPGVDLADEVRLLNEELK